MRTVIRKVIKYLSDRKPEISMGLAAAAVVAIVYSVFNLIVWNEANISYTFFFGLLAFLLFFVAQRFLEYIMKSRKESEE